MKVNPKIFKAYDIRGIFPSEINPRIAYKIGRAFIKFLNKKKLNIVVGRDNRLSSPILTEAIIKGIIDEGTNVVDIKLSTAPMHLFAVAHFGYDGGIMVTASHNPPEYNGFKLVREKAIPIGIESGLKNIQDLIGKIEPKRKQRGAIIKKNILGEYLKFNLKLFDFSKIKNLKIIFDTANAVGGIVIPELLKNLKCQATHLFKKLDGKFPNHLPNPLEEANLKFLKKEVLSKKADLGVAFDGDADRMLFVDEKGQSARGDLITALMAETLLQECPKEKIMYDIRASNAIPETIKKFSGIPVGYKIGHSFIKRKMRQENILFAGELSGHYYSRDHYFLESPIFVLLKILEILSTTKKPLSQIIKPYKRYYYSGEINFETEDKKSALKFLEQKYKSGKISKLDGLRIDFKNWWFLARPSNTEPLLRLVVEAKTEKLMENKTKEISNLIKSLK